MKCLENIGGDSTIYRVSKHTHWTDKCCHKAARLDHAFWCGMISPVFFFKTDVFFNLVSSCLIPLNSKFCFTLLLWYCEDIDNVTWMLHAWEFMYGPVFTTAEYLFCRVWRHTFGDAILHIAAEYFAEHLGRIFCRWQICQMWPGITVVCTFHSVKYCLIYNFQCSFVHIFLDLPQLIYQHPLKQYPLCQNGWQNGWHHINLSYHFLAEYSPSGITLCGVSGSGSLYIGQSRLLHMHYGILCQNIASVNRPLLVNHHSTCCWAVIRGFFQHEVG